MSIINLNYIKKLLEEEVKMNDETFNYEMEYNHNFQDAFYAKGRKELAEELLKIFEEN